MSSFSGPFGPSQATKAENTGLTEEQKVVLAAYCEKVLPWLENMYYMKFDSNRGEVVNLYDNGTPVIWNGYRMQGREGMVSALQQLPGTKHKIETIDCQPIISESPTAAHLILATVTGAVSYLDEITNNFHQVFVLRAEGKDLRIVYDCYRWLNTM